MELVSVLFWWMGDSLFKIEGYYEFLRHGFLILAILARLSPFASDTWRIKLIFLVLKFYLTNVDGDMAQW